MQVGVDVKCMQTEFGGRGFFGFGDIAREREGEREECESGKKDIVLITVSLVV